MKHCDSRRRSKESWMWEKNWGDFRHSYNPKTWPFCIWNTPCNVKTKHSADKLLFDRRHSEDAFCIFNVMQQQQLTSWQSAVSRLASFHQLICYYLTTSAELDETKAPQNKTVNFPMGEDAANKWPVYNKQKLRIFLKSWLIIQRHFWSCCTAPRQ